ncbi:hypothetical protein CLV98_101310 [Dyadobacter jejuensis]|uniref:Uncharacterized protein n=1 Tax=Dyadobacter jejuensis TaxID=1082580 RepID=A0A316AS98_9BACT|nr:hypothetical protein [Dyadobacter jejuensis]PWJ60134.1 hypothetical protein CLV98_101310 [Dyadobacter jejuensis]
MPKGNDIFKEIAPDEKVPEYLKTALVSEVNTIRDAMHILNHFTENFLGSFVALISPDDQAPEGTDRSED